MIAYFEDECPDGWDQYEKFKDRFILGSSETVPVGSFGGKREHLLQENEMPAHQHFLFGAMDANPTYKELLNEPAQYVSWFATDRHWDDQSIPAYSPDVYDEYWMLPTENNATMGMTSNVGGNQPIDIMPPYIAMNACKKVEDISLRLMEQKINNIYDTFIFNRIEIY